MDFIYKSDLFVGCTSTQQANSKILWCLAGQSRRADSADIPKSELQDTEQGIRHASIPAVLAEIWKLMSRGLCRGYSVGGRGVAILLARRTL